MYELEKEVFKYHSPDTFNVLALKIFHFQYQNNPVYRFFCQNLHVLPEKVQRIEQIPFIPIELFKTQRIISSEQKPALVFKSSGTGGQRSSHYVVNPEIYNESLRQTFQYFFGDITEYRFLALLPSYFEQGDSSLVYMMEKLIKESGDEGSGFFLDDYDRLAEILSEFTKRKTILWGVSYALLDFAESGKLLKSPDIVFETGGMKGRRKEMVREELHRIICEKYQVDCVHSEYGMTELLSQAYSKGNGVFSCPPWMKIIIRDINDPCCFLPDQRSGGINVIDLANLNSCSFIATQDIGKIMDEYNFEVLGRLDKSDLRGCNLMIE